MLSRHNRKYLPAVIALGYLFISVLWVSFTDRILLESFSDSELLSISQTLKGWIFVSFSTLVLYVALKHIQRTMRSAAAELDESKDLFRIMFDHAVDGLLLLNEDFTIIDGNLTACRLSGVDGVEDLIGRNIQEFTTERQLSGQLTSEFMEEVSRTLKENHPLRFNWQHLHATGDILITEVSLSKRTVGTSGVYLAVARDITERLNEEAERAREEDRHRGLLELHTKAQELSDEELYKFALDQAVALTDSKLGFLHLISEDQKTIFVTTWNEETRSSCSAAVADHDPLEEAGIWAECIRQQSPAIYNDYPSLPSRKALPEGHVPLIRFMSVPVVDEGNVRICFGVGNKKSDYEELDLLQIQLVSNELQKVLRQRDLLREVQHQESLLKESQRLAHIGSWANEVKTGKLIWSDEVYRIFGVEPGSVDVSLDRFLEMVHPEDRDLVRKEYTNSLDERREYNMYHRIVRPDGSIRQVFERCEHVVSEDGELVRSVGSVQDVTERYLANEELRRSEQKYRSLFGNMISGFALHKIICDESGKAVDFRFIEINSAYADLTGFSAEQTVGRLASEILPDMKPAWLEACGQVALQGEPCSFDEYSPRLDRYFHAWAFSPEAGQFAVILLDVTAQRKTQEALRASERELRTLINSIPDLVWLKDRDGTFLRCNPAVERFFGVKECDIVGKTDRDFLDPAIADEFRENDQRALDEGGSVVNEEILTFADDGYCGLFETVKTPIRDGRGEWVGVLGVARDISWRKRSEDELRKTKEQLQCIIDNTHDSIFQVDLKGNFIYANKVASEASGYSLDELLSMNLTEFVVPEHVSLIRERLNEWIQGNREPSSYSFQVQHKDGHRSWMEATTTGIYDADLNLIALQGAARDVTERILMREALEKRLVALTRPMGNVGDIAFSDLFNLADIQEIQDKFSEATGVASVILDPDGNLITKPSNVTRLCWDIVRGTEKGKRECLKFDCKWGRSSADGYNVTRCRNCGLLEAVAAIRIGEVHVASWVVGQVRDEGVSEEDACVYARGLNVNESEFLEAFHEVPQMAYGHFQKVANSLYSLANHVSSSAYMNLQQARFIMDENRRNEELRMLSAAIRQATEGVVITNAKGDIEYVNPAFESITGYSQDEVKGKNPRILKSGVHPDAFYRAIWDTIVSGKSWTGRIHNRRKDGSIYIEESTISPICDEQNRIESYVAVKHDITQLVRFEEQFRQNQKMEAIGRLASGVAHDFNNILQTIYGLCEVLLMDTAGQESVQRDLAEIHSVAKRAGELTSQLLAFGRKSPQVAVSLDLNEVLVDQASMLSRLLGDRFTLLFEPDTGLCPILADRSQIEQVTMNLVVNARDAMPGGGEIRVETRNVHFSEGEVAGNPEGGDFVCLLVEDKGIGMQKEVVDKLFEPFFTTKPVGEGTGLGLAMIYGIAEGLGGWIDVESTFGEGSTFRVYFPVLESGLRAVDEHEALAETEAQRYKVLLVEDDPAVSEFVSVILSEIGCDVEQADDVDPAREQFELADEDYDLLIVDEGLPGGSGVGLANDLVKTNGKLSVLVVSGHSEDRVNVSEIETRGYFFLKKPFSTESLINMFYMLFQRKGDVR